MAWLSNQFPPCTHDGKPADRVLCVVAIRIDESSIDYEIAYWNLTGQPYDDCFTLARGRDDLGDILRLDEILGYQRLSEFNV